MSCLKATVKSPDCSPDWPIGGKTSSRRTFEIGQGSRYNTGESADTEANGSGDIQAIGFCDGAFLLL